MAMRRSVSREFKLEAVRRLELGEKPVADLARELGVARNRLYKWKREIALKGEGAFQGPGRPKANQESEIARLRRELLRVTEERDILKKAAAFFRERRR